MQSEDAKPWPYSGGYPSWPFARLSDRDLEQLVGTLQKPRKQLAEELVEDFGEGLL